jgi:hypothetical protein
MLPGSAAHAAAPRRVALVVGNDSAASLPAVRSTNGVDARLIARSLLQMGFDSVDLRLNLSAVETRDALRGFAGMANGSDAAVIYVSGEGFAAAGGNWVMGAGATGPEPSHSVNLNAFVDALDAGRGLRLLVVDAPAPSGAVKDLAGIEIADLMVVFSGRTSASPPAAGAGPSVFAIALARRMTEPGAEIRAMLSKVRADVAAATRRRQTPTLYGTLSGSAFYLVRPTSTVALADAEGQAWSRAVRADTDRGFGEYLRLFPEGTHWTEAAVLRARRRAEQVRQGPVSFAGRVIHLRADGTGDYPSLGRALNAAKDGDRLELGPGAYPMRALIVKASVAISGPQKGAPAVLVSDGSMGLAGAPKELWLQDLTFRSGRNGLMFYGGRLVVHRVRLTAMSSPSDATPTAIGISGDTEFDLIDSELSSAGFVMSLTGGNLTAVGNTLRSIGPTDITLINIRSLGRTVVVDNRLESRSSPAFIFSAGPAVFAENEFRLSGLGAKPYAIFPLLSQVRPVVAMRNRVTAKGRPTWVECLDPSHCPLSLSGNTGLAP